jgi:hypothetical protein
MPRSAYGLLRSSGRVLLRPRRAWTSTRSAAPWPRRRRPRVHDLHVWEVTSGFPASRPTSGLAGLRLPRRAPGLGTLLSSASTSPTRRCGRPPRPPPAARRGGRVGLEERPSGGRRAQSGTRSASTGRGAHHLDLVAHPAAAPRAPTGAEPVRAPVSTARRCPAGSRRGGGWRSRRSHAPARTAPGISPRQPGGEKRLVDGLRRVLVPSGRCPGAASRSAARPPWPPSPSSSTGPGYASASPHDQRGAVTGGGSGGGRSQDSGGMFAR